MIKPFNEGDYVQKKKDIDEYYNKLFEHISQRNKTDKQNLLKSDCATAIIETINSGIKDTKSGFFSVKLPDCINKYEYCNVMRFVEDQYPKLYKSKSKRFREILIFDLDQSFKKDTPKSVIE